jgi:hypothetical protein
MPRGTRDHARCEGGETVKTRYYRIFGSLTALSVLSAILAAPKKWG